MTESVSSPWQRVTLSFRTGGQSRASTIRSALAAVACITECLESQREYVPMFIIPGFEDAVFWPWRGFESMGWPYWHSSEK